MTLILKITYRAHFQEYTSGLADTELFFRDKCSILLSDCQQCSIAAAVFCTEELKRVIRWISFIVCCTQALIPVIVIL